MHVSAIALINGVCTELKHAIALTKGVTRMYMLS